jgi:urea transport system permease protein
MRAFCERLLALVFALSVVGVAANGAHADAYEDALAHFLADSFDDTIDGINAVAASGHPLAEKVIVALQDGRLLFSAEQKRVFFKDEADRLFDAASGSPATDSTPADLSPVRLNNRLRRIIEATLGGLTLLAPDPAKRLEAAQAVFKSKDANALPALDQAIAKETNARVKRALGEARAAVILYLDSAAETEKINAVGVIRDRGDNEALAVLRSPRSSGRCQPGRLCKMRGTASRSARCCCSLPSGLPSRSA